MYITEDGWVCPGYSGSDYLCFLLVGDGNRAELYAHIVNDGTPALDSFFWDTARNLRAQGLLSYADLSGEELLEIMHFQPGSFLEVLAQAPEAERQAAMTALTDYLSARGFAQQSGGAVQELRKLYGEILRQRHPGGHGPVGDHPGPPPQGWE